MSAAKLELDKRVQEENRGGPNKYLNLMIAGQQLAEKGQRLVRDGQLLSMPSVPRNVSGLSWSESVKIRLEDFLNNMISSGKADITAMIPGIVKALQEVQEALKEVAEDPRRDINVALQQKAIREIIGWYVPLQSQAVVSVTPQKLQEIGGVFLTLGTDLRRMAAEVIIRQMESEGKKAAAELAQAEPTDARVEAARKEARQLLIIAKIHSAEAKIKLNEMSMAAIKKEQEARKKAEEDSFLTSCFRACCCSRNKPKSQ